MNIPMLSIVIPMFNEEKTVANTVKTLSAYFDTRYPLGDYEIIFSNDGSHDRSAEIVSSLLSDYPHIRLVGKDDNRGKGAAVREGVMASKGQYIVYTDCDLAFGCDAIGNIADSILSTGKDLVIGSRNLSKDGYEGYTPLRRFLSKAYLKGIGILAGFHHSDSQCGIKCMTACAGKDIFSRCIIDRFAFDLEVLILAEKRGYTIGEFPVKVIHHCEGNSKVHVIRDSFRMIRDVFRIKWHHRHVTKN